MVPRQLLAITARSASLGGTRGPPPTTTATSSLRPSCRLPSLFFRARAVVRHPGAAPPSSFFLPPRAFRGSSEAPFAHAEGSVPVAIDTAPVAPPPPRLLFLTDAHNSMSQHLKLVAERRGCSVVVALATSPDAMRTAVADARPDIVVCPILTKPVPEDVWSRGASSAKPPVLIVHPGIAGDRGPHAVDWAVRRSCDTWGVTLLEASAEMDAGDVWATEGFSMPREATKSAVYRTLTVPAAGRALERIIDTWTDPLGGPSARSMGVPQVQDELPGSTHATWTRDDRTVDVSASADDVATLVRACDSAPGARMALCAVTVGSNGDAQTTAPLGEWFAFGAHVEREGAAEAVGAAVGSTVPGTLVARRDGAVLVACGEGTAVWITHLRLPRRKGGPRTVKLRATEALRLYGSTEAAAAVAALPEAPAPSLRRPHPDPTCPSWADGAARLLPTWQPVWYSVSPATGAAYVRWEIQGGALAPEHSAALIECVAAAAADPDSRAVVLVGGSQAWGNGIDLCDVVVGGTSAPDGAGASACAADAAPLDERVLADARLAAASRASIEAIDDLVLAVLSTTSKPVVSALLGGAGAGGAMAALAADRVWLHSDVVLNPHYRAMALTGSEYWTLTLPARVGDLVAGVLAEEAQPVSAMDAAALGLVDGPVVSSSRVGFLAAVDARLASEGLLVGSAAGDALVASKAAERVDGAAGAAWRARIAEHRRHELAAMDRCFAGRAFREAARRFVHKESCGRPAEHWNSAGSARVAALANAVAALPPAGLAARARALAAADAAFAARRRAEAEAEALATRDRATALCAFAPLPDLSEATSDLEDSYTIPGAAGTPGASTLGGWAAGIRRLAGHALTSGPIGGAATHRPAVQAAAHRTDVE